MAVASHAAVVGQVLPAGVGRAPRARYLPIAEHGLIGDLHTLRARGHRRDHRLLLLPALRLAERLREHRLERPQLSTFIGALFVFEGFWVMLTAGIAARAANFVTGLLSIAAGIALIVWPDPSLIVLGIFLGSWLIVLGTLSISGALAGRQLLPDWWLLSLLGCAKSSSGCSR